MSSTTLAKALGLYTGVLALLTVFIAVFVVGSGLLVLLLVGLGLLLTVLGGASGGSVSSGIPSAQSASFGEGESISFASKGGSTSWRLPGRVMMLFYGIGLAVWGFAAMATLGGQLS